MSHPRSGYVFAFIGTTVFSFTLPMVKLALVSFGPWTITLGRMAIAGITALTVVLVTKTPLPSREHWKSIFLTALGISFGFPILTTLALQRTTSAHGAVIIASLPLVTASMAVVRHKERVTPLFWLGAILGAAVLAIYAWLHGGSEGADPLADVMLLGAVFASAFGYAEGAALTKVMPNWHVVTWCVIMFLPISVIGAITAHVLGDAGKPIVGTAVFGFLFTAFGSMYLGFFAWYRGLADLGVARGSQVQLIQPMMTLLWSSLILGEVITSGTLLAALAVLSCVVLTQKARHLY